MRNNGIPTAFISRLMGHNSETTTQHYLASLPSHQLVESTDKLNAFIIERTEKEQAFVKSLEKIIRKSLLPNIDKKTAKKIVNGEPVVVPDKEIPMDKIIEALRKTINAPAPHMKAV